MWGKAGTGGRYGRTGGVGGGTLIPKPLLTPAASSTGGTETRTPP